MTRDQEDEVKRRELLAALQDARGAWKTLDHPELKNGPEAFVEKLREENDERLRTPGGNST